jgi:small-conductance mechanosensitive channel
MPFILPAAPAKEMFMAAAAAVVPGLTYLTSLRWRAHSARALFFVRLGGFVLLTAILVVSGVHEKDLASLPRLERILYSGLEVVWSLAAAWLAVGFLRAFVSFRRKPRQDKLAQDLIAGLIYGFAAVSVAAGVFGIPIKGLLATSGVLAVVLGLALQNSLGDVFSGIVLNIERPYRVGDWIILDETIQGQVIETNWRATHLLTGRQDVAIVPNSVIAKLKIVNSSAPTTRHGASLRIKLEPNIPPGAAAELLHSVLLGVSNVLSSPAPGVTVKDVSAETLELELSYAVADINQVDAVQNEIFDRLYRTAAATGLKFAPRFAPGAETPPPRRRPTRENMAERFLAGLDPFDVLSDQERKDLAGRMVRRVYKAGDVVVPTSDLNILAMGVLIAWVGPVGAKREVLRLAPGDHFSDPKHFADHHIELTALTRAVVYEAPAEAVASLLRERPALADLLRETPLAGRLRQRPAEVARPAQVEAPQTNPVARAIRRILSA